MKRILTMTLLAAVALASCKKDNYEYKGGQADGVGTLSFTGFSLSVTDDTDRIDTRAVEPADNNYMIIIRNTDNDVCYDGNYGDVIAKGSIQLKAGDYTLSALSASEPETAKFDTPVYGVTKSFSITAGEPTTIGDLTCKLIQCKVTVGYGDNFLADVTGDCTTTVELTDGDPLRYELKYNDGKPTYDQHAGYFPVNGGTTLKVTFKGMIDGKSQRMTKAIDGIAAAQWRQIKFVKKIDENGNATFDIEISDYIEDVELGENIAGEEDIIGEDPNAPKGDGGIKLVSTCDYDIEQDIIIPELPDGYYDGNYIPNFVLTMKAIVPDGVRKFTVDLQSSNADFPGAVAMVNNGDTTLDLVNPSSGAIEVFETIVPFPYGDAVNGQTEILFNLSTAQEPILGFKGKHTFVMKVTDNKGHQKDIPVSLVVE